MKTIEQTSNYGNFNYRITAEVGEDVNPATIALCEQGMLNIAYRIAGSAVDKALGVKERKGVEYSEESAQIINAAVSKKLTELVGKTPALTGLKLSFAVTGQHEFGATGDAPTKEATEMWTKVQALPAEKFATALKALGLAEDYTDETGILACKRKLTEAKAAAKAQASALLGV